MDHNLWIFFHKCLAGDVQAVKTLLHKSKPLRKDIEHRNLSTCVAPLPSSNDDVQTCKLSVNLLLAAFLTQTHNQPSAHRGLTSPLFAHACILVGAHTQSTSLLARHSYRFNGAFEWSVLNGVDFSVPSAVSLHTHYCTLAPPSVLESFS